MKLLSLLILFFGIALYLNNLPPYRNLYWSEPDSIYTSSAIQAPVISNKAAEIFTFLGATWPFRPIIVEKLLQDSKFSIVRQFATTLTGVGVAQPIVMPSADRVMKDQVLRDEQNIENWIQVEGKQSDGFQFKTISDYARGYRAGEITPLLVAKRFIENVKKAKSLNAFLEVNENDVLEQAKASTQRFEEGNPLSIMDGVIVTVKDEVYVSGYRSWCGTNFYDAKFERESSMITRLRKAGAVIGGKNTMHELGIGITGHNPHTGIARNPYNSSYHTGGSSSGGAGAVASGIVPVAIGCDGGGSIRIPSGNCGIFGLKTSAGRVTHDGACPLVQTVGQCGPMGATAIDTAIVYNIIAGPDEHDPSSIHQPPVHINSFDSTLEGLKVGVFRPYIKDSSDDISLSIERLMSELESKGAKIIDVEIPNLAVIQKAHTITILSEMFTGVASSFKDNYKNLGYDAQNSLLIASHFSALDYISAQKVKEYSMDLFKEIYTKVDVLLLPNSGVLAPAVSEQVDFEGSQGELNTKITSEVLRFASLANFIGLPSITLPVGFSHDNLPIAVQFMGSWWDEAMLLNIADEIETWTVRHEPEVHFDSF